MSVAQPYKYSNQEKHNQFSLINYSTLLAANTNQSLTVPYLTSSQANGVPINSYSNPGVVAVITVGTINPVMVANNTTAVFPTSSFTASEGELVNAYQRLIKQVKSGDVLSFITNSNNVPVNVVFYLSN